MKAACSFEMSGIDNPANQCRQPRRVKFRKFNVSCNSAFSVCGCQQLLGKKKKLGVNTLKEWSWMSKGQSSSLSAG